jgi:dolichyl-phosphate beta-glucosyltransferase
MLFCEEGSMQPTIVVVPCYNEAARLPVADFEAFALRQPDVGLLLVNDDSRDSTAAVINRLAALFPRQVRTLHLSCNVGKAEAVRQGMLAAFAAEPQYVAYWDADLATPLEAVTQFREVFERRPAVEIVIGARLPLLGRRIRRTKARAMLGRVFAACASRVLRLRITDTQCGAKMFRCSPRIESLFATPFGTRWIFDVELLARWQRSLRRAALDGESRLFEFPLEDWQDVAGSKLKRSDFVRAAGELLTIYRIYRPAVKAASKPAITPLAPVARAELPRPKRYAA